MRGARAACAAGGCLALSLALLGCGTPAAPPPQGVTQGAVLTFATFARITDVEKGIAEGLNIDGRVHPKGDALSCGMPDYTSPEGVPGIDNGFGGLLPTIEKKVGTENLGQLLATAIADGQLLILLAIDGLVDPTNDASVVVRLAAGVGTPLLDANGKFIAYQTFGIDRARAPVSTLPGKIVDGVLFVGPGDAVLPVRVLDAKFNLALHGMLGQVALSPDTGGGLVMSGIFGGGVATSDFQGIVQSLNIKGDAINAATTLVSLVADLAYDPTDGRCKQISAGLKFDATPAFLLDSSDAPGVDAGSADGG